MCGINGIISASISREEREKSVRAMNLKIAHRGPDNDGIWSEGEVSLGHRRLSIIDLSEAGNQPFFSGDKRYVIVYNGELYNFSIRYSFFHRNSDLYHILFKKRRDSKSS